MRIGGKETEREGKGDLDLAFLVVLFLGFLVKEALEVQLLVKRLQNMGISKKDKINLGRSQCPFNPSVLPFLQLPNHHFKAKPLLVKHLLHVNFE